jgi:hypothetical protein
MRLDWQGIANVEALFENFKRKLEALSRSRDPSARAFPFAEFGNRWNLAWQEFRHQLSGEGITLRRNHLHVPLSLLVPSVVPPSHESLITSSVTVISQADPVQRLYGYYTGCNEPLPTNLGPLKLSLEVSGSNNLMESHKQSLLDAFRDAQERRLCLLFPHEIDIPWSSASSVSAEEIDDL